MIEGIERRGQSASDSSEYSYIVGSGWWCSGFDESSTNPNRKLLGDERIRAVGFFKLWFDSIRRCTSPANIVVIDSHSPIKPNPELRSGVAWVELPFNAKHSTNHIGKWSGWTRSVLMSGHFALNSDVDYFVYVEQDCLLEGKKIIEHCISHMKTDLMFGSGEGTPQPLQQSFFIVRRNRLAQFMYNLVCLNSDDRDLSPEWKFVYASWWPLVAASNIGLLKHRRARELALRVARRFFYDHLPIGAGRSRPLPIGAQHLYFQHGTSEELADYQFRVG
jgi:hypothetical protein